MTFFHHFLCIFFFFFNDTATTEIYTLSLHDALPISADREFVGSLMRAFYLACHRGLLYQGGVASRVRSEEHTSELQSRLHLVCRLLLEKTKTYVCMAESIMTYSCTRLQLSAPTVRSL